jgi:hypothetical protein
MKYRQVCHYKMTFYSVYGCIVLDEIFLERHRIKEQRPDSFAEQHAKLAKETAERLNTLGEDLFQVLQGRQSDLINLYFC